MFPRWLRLFISDTRAHMSTPNLKQSAIALALLQAFASPACAQQPMPKVVITGAWGPAERATIGGFSDTPLLYTPASITSIKREQMQDLAIHNTTEASKFDASINDAYNAVGYAEQFSIRGFVLDNTSSYRKDGLAIPGDTQIPLENKERIEVLKGLAGLQAGVAAPGGIVNYAVKRPTNAPLRSATVEARERGTLYGTVDLGGRSDDKRFGYRINAAGERLRSYVRAPMASASSFRAHSTGALRRRPCCSWTWTTSTNRRSALPATS